MVVVFTAFLSSSMYPFPEKTNTGTRSFLFERSRYPSWTLKTSMVVGVAPVRKMPSIPAEATFDKIPNPAASLSVASLYEIISMFSFSFVMLGGICVRIWINFLAPSNLIVAAGVLASPTKNGNFSI